MHCARALSNKMNNDSSDGHRYALLGFNDLDRSVIPTFLSRNKFDLQLSTHCPKIGSR